MSLWEYDKAPVWFPTAVSTEEGWINPTTGEILVAISELDHKRRDSIELPEDNLLLGTDTDLLLLDISVDNRPNFLLI